MRFLSHRVLAIAAASLLSTAACAGSAGVPLSSQSGTADVLLYPINGTATPGPIGAQTQNYAFTAAGAQAEFLVSQPNFTGSFTIASACQTPSQPSGASGVATAAFGVPTGPSAVLTITAGTNGGTCVFTITGGNSKSATVFVGNTATTGNVN